MAAAAALVGAGSYVLTMLMTIMIKMIIDNCVDRNMFSCTKYYVEHMAAISTDNNNRILFHYTRV